MKDVTNIRYALFDGLIDTQMNGISTWGEVEALKESLSKTNRSRSLGLLSLLRSPAFQ
jgi:hypothetical protein